MDLQNETNFFETRVTEPDGLVTQMSIGPDAGGD
jgi:hypothetical protein